MQAVGPASSGTMTKFAVYRNPALSAASTARSLQPSSTTVVVFFSLSSVSAFAFLFVTSRETGIIKAMRTSNFPEEAAYLFVKMIRALLGFVFVGCLFGFFKVISFRRSKIISGVPVASVSKDAKDQPHLTKHQLELLGVKPKVEPGVSEPAKRPPKSRSTVTASDILVPIHQPVSSPSRKSQIVSDKSSFGLGQRTTSFTAPLQSQNPSSSLYLVPGAISPLPSTQASPGLGSAVSSPWSSKRGSASREIGTEEQLEWFLLEIDEKLVGSAGKLTTPPPTIRGLDVTTPTAIGNSVGTPATTRSTPLRSVRMSPGSQKFTTPPKKGEGDLPPPMSIEETVNALKHLGIYPQIEQWEDHLRQWFSSTLLKPLVNKIESSHIQVMQAAARLGISATVSKVGTADSATTQTPATVPSAERKEWQPTFPHDEDGLLHQLRVTLVQAIDASMPRFPVGGLQQSPQQNPSVPLMQECVDAITEHQRLRALLKGEWAKGLLPHSNLPEEYMVQRVRELAEGTCLKNYEYQRSGEVYDNKNKKWTLELPTDSHLLLYLFCAFLEYPKWMLHVDPTSYAGSESSKNPLFVGVLPPKERIPEKYIAVLSCVPSTVNPGACILVCGKQSPPVFALYWDKKLQFSLQGRSALWDAILLMCHRIKVGYGGIVRGMHLSSSALSILNVLESGTED